MFFILVFWEEKTLWNVIYILFYLLVCICRCQLAFSWLFTSKQHITQSSWPASLVKLFCYAKLCITAVLYLSCTLFIRFEDRSYFLLFHLDYKWKYRVNNLQIKVVLLLVRAHQHKLSELVICFPLFLSCTPVWGNWNMWYYWMVRKFSFYCVFLLFFFFLNLVSHILCIFLKEHFSSS